MELKFANFLYCHWLNIRISQQFDLYLIFMNKPETMEKIGILETIIDFGIPSFFTGKNITFKGGIIVL